MSELKARTARSIADEEERLELGSDCPIEPAQVYLKYEADKVIDELKQKINEAQTELELWRDGSIISEPHQKELDEKRHSDYKRCLAMAKECVYGEIKLKRVKMRDMNNHQFWQFDNDYWQKWNNRWLKIAEQFKEAK